MKGMLLCILLLVSLTIVAQPPTTDACGASVYPGSNGRIVSCPPLGTSGDGCLIALSFLMCEAKNGDPAIRINPKDLVVWYSDQTDPATGKLYKFRFDNFTELDQNAHTECHAKGNHDQEPFPNLHGESHRYNHAAYADPNSSKYNCFKQNVFITSDDVHETATDPHVIIGDGTILLSPPDKDKDKKKH